MNQAAPPLANRNEHHRATKKDKVFKGRERLEQEDHKQNDCFRQAGSLSLCFPSGSAVKNLPAIQETQEVRVRFLGREDPLEEGMATNSSIPARRIQKTEKPGGLQPIES